MVDGSVRYKQEERLQKQNKLASFEEAVLPHLDAAYNLAHWLTRNDTDAEDVVQEAYLRAFKVLRRFPWRGRALMATGDCAQYLLHVDAA